MQHIKNKIKSYIFKIYIKKTVIIIFVIKIAKISKIPIKVFFENIMKIKQNIL